MIQRRPWTDFEHTSSGPHAQHVPANDLVELPHSPALSTLVAYAQESLVYNADNRIVASENPEIYAATPRLQRVNVFGLAYRPEAKLYLHKTLATIVKGAAEYLYQTHGWHMVVFDGLRTVEGAFALYNFATDEDLQAGLLALPGKSAHNKGLAVDTMFFDSDGREIEMGGHFDHTDMTTNSRVYTGDRITEQAKRNRLIREAGFLRSALSQGLLIAPLRTEFWDDRLPENQADLWRVIDSVARVCDIAFTPDRNAMEQWRYGDFVTQWERLFAGHEKILMEKIGVTMPPREEKCEFYHGNYHPIYCRDLRSAGKHLTQ